MGIMGIDAHVLIETTTSPRELQPSIMELSEAFPMRLLSDKPVGRFYTYSSPTR